MFKNIIFLFGALIMISCSSESIANRNYYDFNNQKIFFGNYGDKKNPDVLFIHGLMGSSTSFDEIIISLFVAGGDNSTITRSMFLALRDQIDPPIAAISTILIVISSGLLIIIQLIGNKENKKD